MLTGSGAVRDVCVSSPAMFTNGRETKKKKGSRTVTIKKAQKEEI